jgi:hypothetical protein
MEATGIQYNTNTGINYRKRKQCRDFSTELGIWRLLGFLILSIIQYSKKHNILYTGCALVLRWGVGPHMRMGADPVSEKLCSLAFFRIPEGGQSPKTQ